MSPLITDPEAELQFDAEWMVREYLRRAKAREIQGAVSRARALEILCVAVCTVAAQYFPAAP